MKPRPVATKQLTIKIFYFKEERKERKSKEGGKKAFEGQEARNSLRYVSYSLNIFVFSYTSEWLRRGL